jgi:hypothetical protein
VPAGVAGVAGAALFVAMGILISGAGIDGHTDAARLPQVHAHHGRLLLASAIGGLGFAMLAPPLLLLFEAASARSDDVRAGLRLVMIIAPLLLGGSIVAHTIGLNHVASRFVELRGHAANLEKLADDLASDDGLLKLAGGLDFAGRLGVIVGVFYTSRWAFRTGLLRRFLGTFGMAVAVVAILLPFGVMIWALGVGLMLLDVSRAGLPPAWTTGRAMPWPRPGEDDPAAPPPEPPQAG